MKILPLALLLFAAIPVSAEAGDLNLLLAFRDLDEDGWPAVSENAAMGISVGFGRDRWPLQLVTGLSYSEADGDQPRFLNISTDFQVSVLELSFGVQRTWDRLWKTARPYFGGGLSVVEADTELKILGNFLADDDLSFGVYLNGGVLWQFEGSFHVGFDGRILTGTDIEIEGDLKTLTLAGIDPGNVDYWQFGVLVGWNF